MDSLAFFIGGWAFGVLGYVLIGMVRAWKD